MANRPSKYRHRKYCETCQAYTDARNFNRHCLSFAHTRIMKAPTALKPAVGVGLRTPVPPESVLPAIDSRWCSRCQGFFPGGNFRAHVRGEEHETAKATLVAQASPKILFLCDKCGGEHGHSSEWVECGWETSGFGSLRIFRGRQESYGNFKTVTLIDTENDSNARKT